MTLAIILFLLICAVMALLCMPGAVIISQWIEDRWTGLIENLVFWAIVTSVTVTAIFITTHLTALL